MPCFRAPSPSTSSVAVESARDIRAQSKESHVTSRRPHAHKLDKAKTAVQEAAKRAHKTRKLVEPCVAYVGNIGLDVDDKALITHFSQYGKILSASINCCGGVVMTIKPPPPGYHKNRKVRQYAMVLFESKSARRAACKAENILGGQKLTVSTAVSDLSEVQEKISERLEEYRARLEPPDVGRAQKSALRSLKLEPTVLLDPVDEKNRRPRKRLQFMGFSFAESIM